MNPNKYALLIISIWVGALVGITLGLVLMDYEYIFQLPTFKQMNIEANCDGIRDYYTGNGFIYDKNEYLSAVFSYYHDSSKEMTYRIMSPSQLKDYNYDCEDVSHGIYCMGRLYSIKCELYLEKTYGKVEERGHVGVECFFEGKWIEFY